MANSVNNYTVRLNVCKDRDLKLVSDLLGVIIYRVWRGKGTHTNITLDGAANSYVKVDGEDYIDLNGSTECAEKLIAVLGRFPDEDDMAEPDENEDEDDV